MNTRKLVIGGLIAAAVLIVLWIATRPAPPAPRILPVPNGYDELIKAATRLPSDLPDLDTLSVDQQRNFIRTNAPVWQSFKEALTNDSIISDTVEFAQTGSSPHMSRLAQMKGITKCLIVEGKVAELNHRYGDAIQSYVAAISVGAKALRGGVIIDRMVASACEAMGTKPLKTLVDKLSISDCRMALSALNEIDRNREPFETTLSNENAWVKQHASLGQQLCGVLMWKSLNQTKDKARARCAGAITLQRQVILDLAARAYELDTGKPPKSAQDLIPKYLDGIPVDELTRTNLAL